MKAANFRMFIISILMINALNLFGQMKVLSSGDVFIPSGKSYWIGNTTDAGARLRLHATSSDAYFDFYNNLYFRSGLSASATKMTLNSDGSLGLGVVTPAYKLDVASPLLRFKRYDYNSSYQPLLFCFYGGDPRICSTNKVVFYNMDQTDYIDVECKTLYELSDITLKSNIKKIEGALSKVNLLEGVNYTWKNDKKNKTQAGLLAQQVEKIIPEAVLVRDSSDIKSMSYNSLTPYLVEAIKELSYKVDSLEKIINQNGSSENSISNSTAQKAKINSTDEEVNTFTDPILEQNIPNPFNTTTLINFYLPSTVSVACIYIYDMNGVQLKSDPITERGKSNIIIEGSELNAGMYLYALIADGKVIDTKRMILTK